MSAGSKRRPQARRSGSVVAKLVAENACRLCERPAGVRKLTKHRLVPGRLGGAYEYRNVVPLCNSCHVAVENDVGVRRMLRPKLWPIEVAHAISRCGKPWLDRTYPVPAAHVENAGDLGLDGAA